MIRAHSHTVKLIAALLLIAGSFILVYYHVIVKMVLLWTENDNYSHGFLIPVVSLYMIWLDREKIMRMPLKPVNTGIVFLVGSLLFFYLAHIAAELFSMRFSMIPVLLSLSVFVGGWAFAKVLLWPAIYLIFMIPLPAIIWIKIAFPLQLLASRLSAEGIRLLGIPVYREGNIIHLAGASLEVVDACSGLRSLTSLLALSAAFALLSGYPKIRKWIIFLSAVPIAISMNVIRLIATALLGKYFGAEIMQSFLHDISGIIVFMLSLMLLFVIGRLLMIDYRRK